MRQPCRRRITRRGAAIARTAAGPGLSDHHPQQVDAAIALELEALARRHVDDVAIVRPKFDAMARPRKLRDRDEGTLHTCDLEPQAAGEALRRPEGRDLLPQVREW